MWGGRLPAAVTVSGEWAAASLALSLRGTKGGGGGDPSAAPPLLFLLLRPRRPPLLIGGNDAARGRGRAGRLSESHARVAARRLGADAPSAHCTRGTARLWRPDDDALLRLQPALPGDESRCGSSAACGVPRPGRRGHAAAVGQAGWRRHGARVARMHIGGDGSSSSRPATLFARHSDSPLGLPPPPHEQHKAAGGAADAADAEQGRDCDDGAEGSCGEASAERAPAGTSRGSSCSAATATSRIALPPSIAAVLPRCPGGTQRCRTR